MGADDVPDAGISPTPPSGPHEYFGALAAEAAAGVGDGSGSVGMVPHSKVRVGPLPPASSPAITDAVVEESAGLAGTAWGGSGAALGGAAGGADGSGGVGTCDLAVEAAAGSRSASVGMAPHSNARRGPAWFRCIAVCESSTGRSRCGNSALSFLMVSRSVT